MKYEYIKQNDEPIIIEQVLDKHKSTNNYKSSFCFNNKRYYMEDFHPVRNNIIFGEFPGFIHMMESEIYARPIFLELIGNTHINVYKEIEVETIKKLH